MDAHLVLKDNLNIQINTNNRDFITAIDKHLTDYVDNYRFMPRYKSGVWNGQISLFNKPTRSFPYGLLFEVIRYIKEEWNDLNIEISNDVKELYKGLKKDDMEYNLRYYPYDYQKKCIEKALIYSKGIILSCTSSGKSLMIAYIINEIKKYTNKGIIIVPNLSLIKQFKSDLIEYGFDKSNIGIVTGKEKQYNNQIIISTWQSLQKYDDLNIFDYVIVDECHGTKAKVISNILCKMYNAKYRYGFTGTLPQNRLDKLSVQQYIGPVIIKISSNKLMKLGYISKCVIKQIYIDYENHYQGDYNNIKDMIFNNKYRLGLFSYIINITHNNILILVDKIEKEGEVLKEYLDNNHNNKNIVFISGRDKDTIREKWRKYMNEDNNDVILIASYGIFSTGINIPSLKTIIFASSTKSYIRVIQTIGRALRLHTSKKNGSIVYDICDNVKYLKDHSKKRERHYIKEKHDIETIVLNEKDGVYQLDR